MTSSISVLAGGRPGDFLTARHIRVTGSQRDIGRALAAAAHLVHGELARPRPADPPLESVRREWFARNHPIQLERMAGVAEHFGIDPADTSVSADWLGTYELPAGCSVAFFPGEGTKDGHGVLARNFDFPTATLSGLLGLPPIEGERPLGADPWVIESHPDDGYSSVTVGIMDVLGAMDGINEAGLTVALLADNESPDPEPTGGPRVGLAEQQVVRYLLDTCATVEEAKRALLAAKHYYFFTPCHYLVADRTGASFVWEHSPRRNHELIVEADPRSSGRLVCTNHLLHRWPDPTQLPDDSGPIGTAALTYHRWRTLTDSIGDAGVLSRDDIRGELDSVAFRAPVEGARTLWQALYDVEDASVELSFFTHDVEGVSRSSTPVVLRAERPCSPARRSQPPSVSIRATRWSSPPR